MSYETYRDVMGVARAIIVNSKGIGFNQFDPEQIRADVDEAARIADVASKFWTALNDCSNAEQRVKAAMTLNLDASQYEVEVEAAKSIMNECSIQMNEILSGWTKSYHGEWRKK